MPWPTLTPSSTIRRLLQRVRHVASALSRTLTFCTRAYISLVSPVIISLSRDLSEIGIRQGIGERACIRHFGHDRLTRPDLRRFYHCRSRGSRREPYRWKVAGQHEEL